jgi:predicted nucleotidyltransferase
MSQSLVKLQPLLNQLRDYLQETYKHQLDKVILFGSQARGDAQQDSDIDIMIVLNKSFNDYQETQRISHYITDLCLENNVLITCFFTDTDLWQTDDNAFFRNIQKEGIIL